MAAIRTGWLWQEGDDDGPFWIMKGVAARLWLSEDGSQRYRFFIYWQAFGITHGIRCGDQPVIYLCYILRQHVTGSTLCLRRLCSRCSRGFMHAHLSQLFCVDPPFRSPPSHSSTAVCSHAARGKAKLVVDYEALSLAEKP